MKKWILIFFLAIFLNFFLFLTLSWLVTPAAHARGHHYHGHHYHGHHHFGIWIGPPVIRVLPPVYYRPYYTPHYYPGYYPPAYYPRYYREWITGHWEWDSYWGRWLWIPGYWR